MVKWIQNCTAVFWRPFINQTLPDHRFMQDNHPKHTSRRARAFFEENDINCQHTPLESPDLNPIENLWHELKFYLETKVKPQNKQDLVDEIKAFWAKRVTEEKCSTSTTCSRKSSQRQWRQKEQQCNLKIDFTTQNKTAPLGATNFTKVIDQ